MASQAPLKHVILLGAGASKSSGYPLANELRLLLSSPEFLKERIDKIDIEPKGKEQLDRELTQYRSAMDLFRYGGFATVDEFCKLAQGNLDFAEKVDDMRRLTRFVLALPNPERAFQDSEYYPFVQHLFDGSLHKLRNEITVLTFNYDPYLEFILMRAAQERGRIAAQAPTPVELNAMAGGFADLSAWNSNTDAVGNFALCKLHGSIAGVGGDFGHGHLFNRPDRDRVWGALRVPFVPFIAFPWELFDESGNQRQANSFPKIGYNDLGHMQFKATWERAWRACQEAEKISFVGISMHDFLDPGFRYLFRHRKAHPKEIVIANPDAEKTDQAGISNSYTRTMKMLHRTALQMMDTKTDDGQPRFKPRYQCRTQPTFRDFIDREME